MKYIIPPFTAYHDWIYKEICPIVQGRFYDRTDSVDLGFDQKILTPIPEFKPSDQTFTEACIHATERYKQFYDKEIIVLWSGGLDSSTALVSLLMYTDLDLKITASESAIAEWPELYEHLKKEPRIKEIIPFNYFPYVVLSRSGDNTVWVTGEPGDMMFGSKMYRFDQPIPDENGTFDKELGYKVVRYNLDLWAEPWQGIPDTHREFYQPIVDCCPIPIENNFDLTWWLGFACKWQFCTTRHIMGLGENPINYTHFFENDELQLWSMSNNHSVKCPDKDFKNYKHPAKEHIYQYFRDESVWPRFKQDSMHPVWFGIATRYRDIVSKHVKSLNPDLNPDIRIPGLPKWTHRVTTLKMRPKGLGLANLFVEDEMWKVSGISEQTIRMRKVFFPPSLVEQVIIDGKFPSKQTAWEENEKFLDPEFYNKIFSHPKHYQNRTHSS